MQNLFEKIVLLHSRFTEDDKKKKIEQLKGLKENKNEKYLIVSTQVIEVGVDISSNLLVTELAPINSLIQRIGRFLRYEGEKEGKALIWYEVDNRTLMTEHRKYKVYDEYITKKTLQELMKNAEKAGETSMKLNINFHDINSYSKIINRIYTEESIAVESKKVEELILLTMNYSTVEAAIEKFFKLEGSFIRDELSIPTIPNEFLSQLGDMQISEILRRIIQQPISVISKLKAPKEIRLIKEEKEQKITFETCKKAYLHEKDRIIQHIFRDNILAFVVGGSYEHDYGLVMESGE